MTVMLYHSCTCVTTKVLRIHVEVDNEEGGTIGLFHAVKSLPYKCIGLCITYVALKLCKNQVSVKQTGVRRATF